MATDVTAEQKPLWLNIEEKINDYSNSSQVLSENTKEQAIDKIADELDTMGFNVSHHGGNLLQLRWAIETTLEVGKPLLKDLNNVVTALTLEDVTDPHTATKKIISDIGKTWLKMNASERKDDIIQIVIKKRLNLLCEKAKGMDGDDGIRYLYEEDIEPDKIIGALGITDEKFKQVKSAVDREREEKRRVKTLLTEKEGQSDNEKVRYLFNNNVEEKLILEISGVVQSVIDNVKKEMEEELKVKKRREEEEAAKKKAAAEGPGLEDISSDDMLEFIETIRDILDICDKEDEIRGMCQQSSVPKCLIDIAISDPDKLDDLESEAEG